MFQIFIVALGIVLLVAIAARNHFRSRYAKHKAYEVTGKVTGAELAEKILEAAGVPGIRVMEHGGSLPDVYDPKRKHLMLSRENFSGTSASALAVAAHESGHALQHFANHPSLHTRLSAVRTTQIFSCLSVIVCALIAFLTPVPVRAGIMAIGTIWSLILGYNLMTLAVEFDATRRAKDVMENKLRFPKKIRESEAMDEVMTATALRHLGAFITSFLYLPYHLMPFYGRKGT